MTESSPLTLEPRAAGSRRGLLAAIAQAGAFSMLGVGAASATRQAERRKDRAKHDRSHDASAPTDSPGSNKGPGEPAQPKPQPQPPSPNSHKDGPIAPGNGEGGGNGKDGNTGGNGNTGGHKNGNDGDNKNDGHGKRKHRGGSGNKNDGNNHGNRNNGNGKNAENDGNGKDGTNGSNKDSNDGNGKSGNSNDGKNGTNKDNTSNAEGNANSAVTRTPTGKTSREDLPGVVLGTAPIVRIDSGQRIGLVQVNREKRDKSGDKSRDSLKVHIMELADDQLWAGVTIATRRTSKLAWERRETFINKGEVGTWSSFAYDVEFAPGDGYQLRLEPLAEDARPGSDTRGDKVSQNEPTYITVFG